MKFQAIIFDLFGTLVDNFSKKEHDKVHALMAETLSAPYKAFRQAFGSSFSDLCIGKFRSIEEIIAVCCAQIGLSPSDCKINTAAQYRYDFTMRTIKPKDEVLLTLQNLKNDGYKIGLITNCGPDVPLLWHTSPLSEHIDLPLFSCREKIQKPAIEIYKRAHEQLGLSSNVCVYVGDGSNQEMTGAKEIGFLPVLKQVDLEDVYDDARPDIIGWQGLSITEIEELPELLAHTNPADTLRDE